jgi:hypothetical protein
MDTLITLGTFVFRNLEIPQFINFGGQQMIAQHDLIGGNRVIDSLGKSDTDISWSGLITGNDSLTRAQQLNQMRVLGRALQFSWFNLTYTVIILNIILKTERFYQIAFDISLKVLVDGTNPNSTINTTGFNEAITSDMQTLQNLANNSGDPNVITAITNLATAVQAVPTFNGATSTTTALVTTAITNAQSVTNASIATQQTNLFGN